MWRIDINKYEQDQICNELVAKREDEKTEEILNIAKIIHKCCDDTSRCKNCDVLSKYADEQIVGVTCIDIKTAENVYDAIYNKSSKDISCHSCIHYNACAASHRSYGRSLENYIFNNLLPGDCENYQAEQTKDSVVLSNEEYDVLKFNAGHYDPFWFCSFGGCEGVCKECKDTCEKSIFVKERKDTIEKIASRIRNRDEFVKHTDERGSMPHVNLTAWLDEIIKQILEGGKP